MIHVQVSDEDREKIRVLRQEHPNPRVRKRLDVLWFKCQQVPHSKICQLADISQGTMRQYFRLYQAGGLERLQKFNYYAPTSDLEQHRGELSAYFRAHPPRTIKEAMFQIEQLTGIKRSHGVVGPFLHSLGMAPRKVGAIPSNPDLEEQENWRINKLEPRLEEAKQGKRAIFLSMLLISCLAPFLVFSGPLSAYL